MTMYTVEFASGTVASVPAESVEAAAFRAASVLGKRGPQKTVVRWTDDFGCRRHRRGTVEVA